MLDHVKNDTAKIFRRMYPPIIEDRLGQRPELMDRKILQGIQKLPSCDMALALEFLLGKGKPFHDKLIGPGPIARILARNVLNYPVEFLIHGRYSSTNNLVSKKGFLLIEKIFCGIITIMKKSQRLGFKAYFFIFFLMVLGNGLSLLYPETAIYTYYHIISTFQPNSAIYYKLAIASTGLTALSLVPLFLYAFLLPRTGIWFFKPLFFARILGDLLGHNYEWQFLVSSLTSEPIIGIANLSLFIAIIFPSYRAHYLYVFKTDPPK